ncbi:MAG: glycosyltransferase family 4 protein [Verrucomicrobia bacterium]|nr:glycosyltransferase family 4 protein [Verrucomicrobiota bacterium]
MNVLVTCEQHFTRTADGRVWTDGQFPYSFWTRYLAVFDSVRVLARVRDAATLPAAHQPASGPWVTFSAIPDYLGPQQFVLQLPGIVDVTARAVQRGDAVILRVSSPISWCIERRLRKEKRPYGVEVVADPYDVFSPNGVRHPLRSFFRWWSTRCLCRQCGAACAAAYVTEHALQRRYPPGPGTFATHYSSVELPPAAFVDTPRAPMRAAPARLIFVGTLAQLYKAPDVLIDAVAACVRDGMNLELVIVGSGRHQPELQSRAAALGLGGRVHFRGQLTTPAAVRAELDQAQLFVLPSRQEGLPRAMIEAMARALPCVGSTVGGIPELAAAEDLVNPNDAAALAGKISEVLADPARMARMSARNLAKAREYGEALGQRRKAFYHYVEIQTAAWVRVNGNRSASTYARAPLRSR